MIRRLFLMALQAAAFTATAPAFAQQSAPTLKATPAAQRLFEEDWVLMNWALKYFDRNHDIMLGPDEAQAAAETFRKLADTNHDGRVTTEEYAAARSEILQHE